jgi:hypothetical protein
MSGFKKATRTQAKARIAIAGPSGSGKTMTALEIARGLVGPKGRIGVIDTEKDSASLYADEYDFDTLTFDPPFDPLRYVKAMELAEEQGFDCLIIDSITHEWNGTGGVQEMVDAAKGRMRTNNAMMAWAEVTPKHNAFIDKMVRINCHLIATMRSKTSYEISRDSSGTTTVTKLGLAPIQREGVEYEFTVYGDLDLNHRLTITKSRMRALQDKQFHQPDASLGRKIAEWLGSAEAQVEEEGTSDGNAGVGSPPSEPSSSPDQSGESAPKNAREPAEPKAEGALTREGGGAEQERASGSPSASPRPEDERLSPEGLIDRYGWASPKGVKQAARKVAIERKKGDKVPIEPDKFVEQAEDNPEFYIAVVDFIQAQAQERMDV